MWKWKAVLSCGLLLVFINCSSQSPGLDYDDYDQKLDSYGRCPWIRNKLKNGRVRIRSRGRIAKFSCKAGYELIGRRFATCVRGQWNNPVPICIAKGCRKVSAVVNGRVTEQYLGASLTFECNPGYSIFGDSTLYCDGKQWDKEIPKCEVTTLQPLTSCDFEDPDLCGWVHDPTHDFDWKRNQFGTPSGHVGTGPSYDHTYGKGKAGFYMYEEASAPRNENDTSRLFSPVYSKHYSPGCFVFWYHMYGATIGSLRIYIKKQSSVFIELSPSWEKSGDQGNQWLRGDVTVPPLNENFQIVIEGIRGSSYVGDTAIDDVSLLANTECSSLDSSNSTEGVQASEDSCRGRCHEMDNSSVCGCTDACESNNTCCSDYQKLCSEKAPAGEEEDLQTTAKMETDAAPETTAADRVGTALTAAPPVLYTEAEAPVASPAVTTEKNTQKLPMTEHISTAPVSLLITSEAPQITNETTTSNTSKEFTTQEVKNTIPPTPYLPVSTVISQIRSKPTLPTKEPTTQEKVSTPMPPTAIPPLVATTRVPPATTTSPPATTKPKTTDTTIKTTTTTAKGLSAVTNTFEHSTPPEGTVTNLRRTSAASSSFPGTTETGGMTFTIGPSHIPATGVPPVSSKNTTNITSVVTNTTSVVPNTTVPVRGTVAPSAIPPSRTAKNVSLTTAFSISSSKTTPYVIPTTVQTTVSRGWKSTSLGTTAATSGLITMPPPPRMPTVRMSTPAVMKPMSSIVTSMIPSATTKLSRPLVTTYRYERPVRPSTKQVVSLRTTESVPVVQSTKSDIAHASKAKANKPENNNASAVGISVGLILVACCIGGVAYVYLRRRRQAQSKLHDDSEMRFLPDSEVIEYVEASNTERFLS